MPYNALYATFFKKKRHGKPCEDGAYLKDNPYLCFGSKLKAMSDDLILVQNLIHEIRGKKVMLDFDLARLYQVETKALNQAVKRNMMRFPPDFMFQLTAEEVLLNRSQIVTGPNRNISTPPFAFTEQGVAMLSGVLKSPIAIAANIAIMRAFVQVREALLAASTVTAELRELRAKVDLLAMEREEDLGALNDLSEDVRQDIDNLYLAIGELAARIEEKKKEPIAKIGFEIPGHARNDGGQSSLE